MTLKGQKLVWDNKQKKFVPGAASPWLPPEQLRGLPGDMVTKDTSDPDKAHELDAPHIVESLQEDWEVRQGLRSDPLAPKPGPVPDAPEREVIKPGANVPLNQERIDHVRYRVLKTRIDTAIHITEAGYIAELDVKHLWFPMNNINVYELRPGPAARDKERPKHLRGYELEVDVFNWPRRIVGLLEAQGVTVPDPKKLWKTLVEQAALRRQLLNLEATHPWQ